MPELEFTDAFLLDVDCHMVDLWEEVGDLIEQDELEWFAAFIHYAFLLGYTAATDHGARDEPGKLFKDHGWT